MENRISPGDIVPALSGLTHQQLRPIAEAVAGEAVASFEITQEHIMPRNWLERWGGKRTYGIPSFCYKTKSGRTSKESVFVKRTVADFPWSEADAYRWLGAANAPIPKGFGCLLGPNREQILFIEHLCGTNGDEVAFFSDASNLHEFLVMSARFDAIAPPSEYSATLAGCKVELQDFKKWRPALKQIWEEAEQELLGADLKQLCSPGNLRAVEALADHAARMIGEMPRGLVKADHRLSNIGRRGTTNDLVMFDFDNTTIGPRFDAVADFLGGNDFIRLYSSGPANVLIPRPEPREKSVELYLKEYNRVGGARAELAEVLAETHILLAAHLFHDIKNWPANMFYWWRSDSDSEAIAQEKRAAIRQILLALLDEAQRD